MPNDTAVLSPRIDEYQGGIGICHGLLQALLQNRVGDFRPPSVAMLIQLLKLFRQLARTPASSVETSRSRLTRSAMRPAALILGATRNATSRALAIRPREIRNIQQRTESRMRTRSESANPRLTMMRFSPVSGHHVRTVAIATSFRNESISRSRRAGSQPETRKSASST